MQRFLRRTQRRIGDLVQELEQSHAELSSLNQDLEGKVERRSAQLRGAFSQLQHKERRLREVSARAVTMQEGERRAIARDLHDSAGRSLTAIRLKLQLLRMTVKRRIGDLGDDLRRGLESACYRLAQEALNNVAKHADAGAVSVRLEPDGGELLLEVEDDSRGFDPDALGTSGHGLAGMRERAELLGGTLELRSEPGEGTRLAFRLPTSLGLASRAEQGQDEIKEVKR